MAYSHDDLVKRIKSPGWRTRKADVTGTLEDVLNVAHQRRSKGEGSDLIQEVDTEVELTLIEIEKLWRYLGLPV